MMKIRLIFTEHTVRFNDSVKCEIRGRPNKRNPKVLIFREELNVRKEERGV